MIQDIIDRNEDLQANQKQLAVLKEYFPACFKTDGYFDIERFRSEISTKADLINEGYELKFLGKNYAKLLASTDTTTVIQPNEKHNALHENINSENIYISGDNLDGLKHLLKSYQRSIKCIYIDPPYNTGTDGFVYQDKFNYSKEELQDKLSLSEEEAERILELTRRGSASHSAWLMFMYSRLLLARDLMTDDGVIFISIDDNEQANLKLLCDDVFGEENFLGQIIHNKLNSKNDTINIQKNHDYITCYRRRAIYSSNTQVLPSLKINKHIVKEVFKEDDRFYLINDAITTRGDGGTLNSRKNLGYTIYYNPDTKDFLGLQDYDLALATVSNNEEEIYADNVDLLNRGYTKIRPPKVRGQLGAWTWDLINFNASKDEILIKPTKSGYSVKKRTFVPSEKVYQVEERYFVSFENVSNVRSVSEFSSNEGAIQLSELLGVDGVFSNPKNINLIQYLISLVDCKDSIFLDFFSGSGSTAHSIMQLNANDDGKRKFITIQLPERIDSNDISQKAASIFLRENGLPLTLDFIGIERIKRAAAKIKSKHADKELDLGFKHYTLVEPNQNTLDKLESFDRSALLVDTNVIDDFGKPTILATWLNTDGYGLTAQAQAIDLAGYAAYYYEKHLYFIDPNFNLESMKALLAKYDSDGHFNPENLILFGYSFPDWSINEMVEKNLRVLNDCEKNLKINYTIRY
ncbi:site-specific DNA-methyltransferase [Mucilaginibacter sp. CSA2-8R]|uniref:site-specific DNA-methyltransferase n=1 Tax=Mucilaginibacter sp. CSA2-8R TaxID=3141542 RepID=UPI00315DE16B